MTYTSLSLTLIFVCIPLLLSKTLKLGLEKDTLIATLRSIVQLLAVGYILKFVFDANSYVYIFLMVALMILVATFNARKKGEGIKGITWKIALTLVMIEIITQGVLLGFNIVPATAQYIIPISGMLIGNSMVLSILFLNRFTAEITSHKDQMELILSLGGTPKQAVHRQLINAVKASMIPTIESQKTIGLVQLPGMMSGQIIGGADPIQAVQFQLLIIFALLTTATLSSIMIGFLSYPALFNERMQILELK
ncbi:iron export ABC transporter permease subunit FetB [Lysinibacillus sp. FSL M8-0216]|uniref:Putative ABC transport system permease protein n=1 Tax=Lysinibacillus fusiformis TaxID=28031 RepID=A0A1H9RS52_9BACI|nr:MULTISPECIES: iron export ABC transporter permease subunit FetB [Lysinibacillus]MED4671714.1 iron export ABC transporter permease subunit FetB [Lysinibacillus fusiformis]NOG30299.1 iron export ABC transporter permease subunit FetB [Lysinibacillus fusiformis]PCD81304.1 iron export ABC transporter permease subunit FetB [Lysinibacillus fusiformis]QAS57565.1 iron export ABC transporter permease subunit FetB [Lysinibacillus sphaericus]RDV36050.1 iron export ABC transporter permease subunit FetB 